MVPLLVFLFALLFHCKVPVFNFRFKIKEELLNDGYTRSNEINELLSCLQYKHH